MACGGWACLLIGEAVPALSLDPRLGREAEGAVHRIQQFLNRAQRWALARYDAAEETAGPDFEVSFIASPKQEHYSVLPQRK